MTVDEYDIYIYIVVTYCDNRTFYGIHICVFLCPTLKKTKSVGHIIKLSVCTKSVRQKQ